MFDIENMFTNESNEDIISFYASKANSVSIIKLDMLFNQFKYSATEKGGLLLIVRQMSHDNILETRNHPMIYFKGSHWKEPAFMTEKKYGIE